MHDLSQELDGIRDRALERIDELARRAEAAESQRDDLLTALASFTQTATNWKQRAEAAEARMTALVEAAELVVEISHVKRTHRVDCAVYTCRHRACECLCSCWWAKAGRIKEALSAIIDKALDAAPVAATGDEEANQ